MPTQKKENFKNKYTQTEDIDVETLYEEYKKRYEPIFLVTDLSTESLDTCEVVANQSYWWYKNINMMLMTWLSEDFRRMRAWLANSFLNPNKKVLGFCKHIYNQMKEDNIIWHKEEEQKDEASNDYRCVKMKKVKVKKEE